MKNVFPWFMLSEKYLTEFFPNKWCICVRKRFNNKFTTLSTYRSLQLTINYPIFLLSLNYGKSATFVFSSTLKWNISHGTFEKWRWRMCFDNGARDRKVRIEGAFDSRFETEISREHGHEKAFPGVFHEGALRHEAWDISQVSALASCHIRMTHF